MFNLMCPRCGRFGEVRHDGSLWMFTCPVCGFIVSALNKKNLRDKLNRLADKFHTGKVLAHPPPMTPPPQSARRISPSSPARFVLRAIAKGLSLLEKNSNFKTLRTISYNRGG